MIDCLVILGATGDLTSRYLLPALATLAETAQLPEPFHIRGLSSQNWEPERFRSHIAEHLKRHSDADEGIRRRLLACLEYRSVDVTDRHAVAAAVKDLDRPAAAYLALPSALFTPAIEALAPALPPGSRVVVEKPFGDSLASARALNRLLHQTFPEEAVFRIDHFLGLQPVQNLLGLRFANRLLEPLWNYAHIERIEIVWDETLALEGRASYYEPAGALRDMIQNHLLQVLCLVGMEPPLTLGEHDVRDRKVDVLRAVESLSAEDVEARTVRGRYGEGRVGSRTIPAYVKEPGVDPARGTETFAQVRLFINNWRWAGVPFVLRTGKALARDRQEVLVRFKPVPHPEFGKEIAAKSNHLRIPLSAPDRLALQLNVNGREGAGDVQPIALDAELAPQTIPAYGRVLLDVLTGGCGLSIRDDEAEESWRIVEPILQAWQQGKSRLRDYPAGGTGPFLLQGGASQRDDERDRMSAS